MQLQLTEIQMNNSLTKDYKCAKEYTLYSVYISESDNFESQVKRVRDFILYSAVGSFIVGMGYLFFILLKGNTNPYMFLPSYAGVLILLYIHAKLMDWVTRKKPKFTGKSSAEDMKVFEKSKGFATAKRLGDAITAYNENVRLVNDGFNFWKPCLNEGSYDVRVAELYSLGEELRIMQQKYDAEINSLGYIYSPKLESNLVSIINPGEVKVTEQDLASIENALNIPGKQGLLFQ